MGLLEKIFGNYSDKEIKRILPIVDEIEAMEPDIAKLSDEELRAKTPYFKERLANGDTLERQYKDLSELKKHMVVEAK